MKTIFTLALAVCAAFTICGAQDERTTCAADGRPCDAGTCCQGAGCCDLPNAVCCPHKHHCCPQNTRCVGIDYCASNSTSPVPGLYCPKLGHIKCSDAVITGWFHEAQLYACNLSHYIHNSDLGMRWANFFSNYMLPRIKRHYHNRYIFDAWHYPDQVARSGTNDAYCFGFTESRDMYFSATTYNGASKAEIETDETSEKSIESRTFTDSKELVSFSKGDVLITNINQLCDRRNFAIMLNTTLKFYDHGMPVVANEVRKALGTGWFVSAVNRKRHTLDAHKFVAFATYKDSEKFCRLVFRYTLPNRVDWIDVTAVLP